MKKILSLIMALTLVMGVNAAFKPLNKKAPKNAPRLEQVQKQKTHKTPTAAQAATVLEVDAVSVVGYGLVEEEGYNPYYEYQITLYNSVSDYPMLVLPIYPETESLEGTFSVADETLGFSYVILGEGEDDFDVVGEDGVLTVKKNGDQYTFSGSFTGSFEEQAYSFSVTQEVKIESPYNYDWEPDEKITINFTPTDYEFQTEYEDEEYGTVNLIEENGIAMIYLYNNDWEMDLEFNTDNSTLKQMPAGTYPINDSYEENTFTASVGGDDWYDYGCFIATDFSDEGYGTSYYIVSGSVTVSYDEENNITITVKGTTAKGSTVNVTYKGSGTPGPQPTPGHTIVMADYADVNFTTTDGAYTIATDKNGGTSAPAYNGNGEDLRLYAKNMMTLTKNTKNGPMTKIVFNISDKGLTRQAEVTPSVGKMAYDMTNATVTWTGEASEVTFTVGDKAVYGTDGESKAGQFDFTSMDIEPNEYSALVNIKAVKAVKTLINGQVVIERNGRQYNLLGF